MRWTAWVLALLIAGPAAAGQQAYHSGSHQVTLLELYTSEGCSSCPPADRWLSGLKSRDDLWSRLVPVAFHVDYWDHLGWKDRFSDARFSRRQRAYAGLWGHGVVYTPGFVLNGREWRGGPFRGSLRLADGPAPGRLRAMVDGRRVAVRYRPDAPAERPLVAHVAVLGFDRETAVDAGENRGRTLHHDFVVLAYRTLRLASDPDKGLTATAIIPEVTGASGRTALATWVSARGSPAPLQATGGWL